MADLDWPDDLFPFRTTFYLKPHVGGSESPLTRTRKVYALSRPRWVCRLSFRGGYDEFDGKGAYGARLDAFTAEMEGGFNRVGLWDFRRPYPRALERYYRQFEDQTYSFSGGETFRLGEKFVIPADAEPLNQTGLKGATTIVFSGLKPFSRVFNIGDYFGGDGRAHLILDNAESDAMGDVSVRFTPPLENDLLAGSAVTMRPKTMFRLNGEDAGKNESEVGNLVIHNLDFEEDLP